MAQDLFHYEQMVDRAMRGVIRDALARVAKEGLRSAHHFYIGFSPRAPGVVIPPSLLDQFPDEMTIILPHHFWDLEVGDDTFSVSLSFEEPFQRLTIPFAAIRRFADPSVAFSLTFAEPPAASVSEPALPAVVETKTKLETAAPQEKGQVVTLDSFRKR